MSIKAKGIIKIYEEMTFDAINVGPNDLAGGIAFLEKNATPQWISASFFNKAGLPVFRQFIVKDFNQLKIAIIGLTPEPHKMEDGYIYKNWQEIIPEIMPKLPPTTNFIVLLSALSLEENVQIAEKYPLVRIIVTAHNNQGNIHPQLTNNALLIQTANKGRYLGHLSLNNLNYPKWQNHQKLSIHSIQQQLQPVNYRLNRLRVIQAKTDAQDKLYKQLSTQKEKLQKKLTELNTQKENDSVNEKSKYSAQFIPLGQLVKEDQNVHTLVEKIKNEIFTYNKEKRKNSELKQLRERFNKNLIGYSNCGSCHEQQRNFWLTTSHATSLTTLKNKGEAANTECLVCHVTQEPRQFQKASENSIVLLNLPEQLQVVGCESCHGAGRLHMENPSEVTLDKKISSNVCLNCHTEERDDNFDFLRKREIVACPAN